MPKKGHSEEQIVAVLRQGEAGARVEEVCRKAAISDATYYLWKRQYSGVGVSELRELRQLREENGRLKRLVANCPSEPLLISKSPAPTFSKHNRRMPLMQAPRAPRHAPPIRISSLSGTTPTRASPSSSKPSPSTPA